MQCLITIITLISESPISPWNKILQTTKKLSQTLMIGSKQDQ